MNERDRTDEVNERDRRDEVNEGDRIDEANERVKIEFIPPLHSWADHAPSGRQLIKSLQHCVCNHIAARRCCMMPWASIR